MSYILGIDLGGTKTHAIVTDDAGNVLGLGRSKGANYTITGLDFAVQCIREAADAALAESGLTIGDIGHIGAGLTCVDWDYEEKMFADALKAAFGMENVHVVNDCIIAMRAATSGTVSAIICAGTGMNCAVQNGDDRFIYGYYVANDRQGGGSIASETLQAVFDAELGLGDETALTPALLAFFGVGNVTELLHDYVMKKIPEEKIMELPKILSDVAVSGDAVAKNIWITMGKRMADCLTARARIMGLQNEKLEVVLSGSIFKTKCTEFRETVEHEIRAVIPNAVIVSSAFEPVVGAALLALDHVYGADLPDTVYRNLEDSAKTFPITRRCCRTIDVNR